MTPAQNLDLAQVEPVLREHARKAFEARDALRFVSSTDNMRALALVADNCHALLAVGMYEPALLQALTGARVNHAHWDLSVLRELLALADRDRLRQASDPLPGPGPFRLFRGVAGTGRRRKVRGLHWTTNVQIASWFAHRTGYIFGDPAVYVATVPASAVLAYHAERDEQEFVVLLPSDVRLQRLPELPKAMHLNGAA